MSLVIYQLCIFLEHLIAALFCGLLEKMNGTRVIFVLLTLASHLMGTYAVQCKICGKSKGIKCLRMKFFYIILDIFQCDSAYTTYGSCKVTIDHILGNSDCLKDLRSLIGLDSGNTHLGSDLYDTADHRMIVIINGCVIVLIQHMCIDQLMNRIQCQIRIDCTCTISEECCEMMYLSRLTGLQDQGKGSALLCFYKMLMYCGNRQQGRDRHMVLIHTAVRKDQDVCALTEGFVYLYEQTVNGTFKLCALII